MNNLPESETRPDDAATRPDDAAMPPDRVAARRDSLAAILTRLDSVYGPHRWQPTGRPMAELVATILSQHTSDINSGRAFKELAAAFPGALNAPQPWAMSAPGTMPGQRPEPDYAAVRDAPQALVARAIRSGGLAEVKAGRIQAVLMALSVEGGPPRLPDLASMPVAEATAVLTSLPGVGPKTAACVLLFAVGQAALPVDTHVHRVSQRLGLLPKGMGAGPAHTELTGWVPPADVYRFHVNLIQHGRRICRAPLPRCNECCLRELCPYPSSLNP